jgi:hypothetical protein
LHLYSEKCRILIGKGSAKKGEVWLSEWDKPIEIAFDKVEIGAKFMMWNATSHTIGASTNDWGNYGMLVEEIEEEKEWLLRCSQGMMPILPDFESLILRIRASPSAVFLERP